MRSLLAVLCAVAAAACAAQPKTPSPPPAASPAQPAAREPFSSTYQAPASPVTLIRNATVLTGTGTRIDGGDVLIEGGRIKAVGSSLDAPEGAVVGDAKGRWVAPGHIGV